MSPASRAARATVLLLSVLTLLSVRGSVATVCDDTMCYPDPPPPPRPGCIQNCVPAGHPAVNLTGTIRDPRGAPIVNAWVYWQHGTSVTDSVGGYLIQVWGDAPVELTADHPLYKWQRREVAQPSPLVPQHFSLRHIANAQILPIAINPTTQTSVTVEVTTTAPRIGSKVVARVPYSPTESVLITLAFDTSYSSPAGWSRWRGAATIPGSSPDNRYIVNACVLDQLATGDCTTPAGLILSEVADAEYFIDRVAPALGTTNPARFADVLDVPLISVTVNDDPAGIRGSGLDVTAVALFLDDVQQAATVSGSTVTASPQVSLGVHAVRLRAVDRAGNQTNHDFVFTRISVTGSPADATLEPMTVAVNPSGTSPPPTVVTLSSPTAQIPQFDESLNASSWVGHGDIVRSVAFGTADVLFDDGHGNTTTVSTSIPVATTQHHLAVLGPSALSANAR